MYNLSFYYYEGEIQVRTYHRPITSKEDETKEVTKETKTEDASDDEGNDCKDEGRNDTDTADHSQKNELHSQQSSYNRTIQAITGIARANKWDYFVTLTLNPKLIRRDDLELLVEKFATWVNNLKKRKCPDMKYLIVPELHEDGVNYHLHGLFANCDNLLFTDSGKKDKLGRTIYNLENWRYGWTTATKVTDTHRVSAYITKYITKQLCVKNKNKRRYWASKNCIRKDDVREDFLLTQDELEEFIKNIHLEGKVTYEKSIRIPDANQIINYYELKM